MYDMYFYDSPPYWLWTNFDHTKSEGSYSFTIIKKIIIIITFDYEIGITGITIVQLKKMGSRDLPGSLSRKGVGIWAQVCLLPKPVSHAVYQWSMRWIAHLPRPQPQSPDVPQSLNTVFALIQPLASHLRARTSWVTWETWHPKLALQKGDGTKVRSSEIATWRSEGKGQYGWGMVEGAAGWDSGKYDSCLLGGLSLGSSLNRSKSQCPCL